MKIYKLKTGYTELAAALLKKGQNVIAPKFSGRTLLFGKIEKAEDAVEPERYVNTVRSAKEFIFPATEPVVEFSYKNKDVKVFDSLVQSDEKIILGLRPCDAAAFTIIDDVFNYEYKDEFYAEKRKNTTLVSFSCEHSDEACFCSSVGLRPDSPQGSDLLFKKDVHGNYFAYSCSEKGEKLVALLKEIFEETTEDFTESPCYEEVLGHMRPPLDTVRIKEWLDKNFENPLWDEFASRCLGCGSCAFLCPTCHCFDIVDETKYSSGLRRKNWDACQFPLFTLHASGHNPRPLQSKRYRQRVMHKFKYYNDRFNKTLCTGCGRCVRACPVNLDIYQVVSEITKENSLEETLNEQHL
ncbi:MAG: 4Fe-4S binding protein [Ignavibacteria bacterium]|jgi:ferredoxin|nr:4Fe-4S binding protein [Ignavibacteria bacterium]MCU7503491.1 4Fe-4S binding protein [Ignavibacteria bacterium]MCU7516177.1 4Fe-4S binding protein [Ignavibacteria bacterium]